MTKDFYAQPKTAAEPESSHPYLLQTHDVSDCDRSKYDETRPLSAKINRKHSNLRLCAETYSLGDI